MSTETTSEAEICIDPEDFDPSRVVLHDPQQNEFKIGDTTIKTTTSTGKYLDDEGRECTLYIRAEPQNTFGFSYTWEIGISKDERTPETAKGLQICYPLTSRQTVQSPTPKEQAFRELMLGLWQATVDKGKEELEKEESLLPAASLNSFLSASKKGQWEKAVKVPFSRPKLKEDKKNFDTTKAETTYIKLVTRGRGSALKVDTIIHGPGDKLRSALYYVDTPGILTPVFKWEGAYHGAHGSDAPYGTSLRFKLVQANFTPKSFSSIPQYRMLSKNTAPVEEDEDVFPKARLHADDGDDEEEETFSKPGSDSNDPKAALAKAAKGKAPTAVAKVPTKGAKAAPAKPKTVLTKASATKASASVKVAAKKSQKAPPKAAPKKVVEVEPDEVDEEDIVEDEE